MGKSGSMIGKHARRHLPTPPQPIKVRESKVLDAVDVGMEDGLESNIVEAVNGEGMEGVGVLYF
jgi:hypothetical protein